MAESAAGIKPEIPETEASGVIEYFD